MIEVSVGDWVVARTNRGNIDAIVTKINNKTLVVRMQIAGKFKYIKRRYSDILEVVGG